MRISKVALIIGFAIASLLFWEVAVHANPANQTTKLPFSEALQIPGQILPGPATFSLTLILPPRVPHSRFMRVGGLNLI